MRSRSRRAFRLFGRSPDRFHFVDLGLVREVQLVEVFAPDLLNDLSRGQFQDEKQVLDLRCHLVEHPHVSGALLPLILSGAARFLALLFHGAPREREHRKFSSSLHLPVSPLPTVRKACRYISR
ncbi:MAG: hypothetical protein E6Q76_02180 [Rhizobium sp.]|nr:MAG: hypothetical protein E6Q76_02180 [Rhizobium sp.]